MSGFGVGVAVSSEPVPDEDFQLIEGEDVLQYPLVESPPDGGGGMRVVVPQKGSVFRESDGAVKVAIIRPCVSRGKRIRGLPPIYTQEMLAENAGVFKNWLMFQDHLTPAMIEALKGGGRSVRDLGGRLVETWYDPQFRMPDDDDYGIREGAVVGWALPQPGTKAMIEADPEILRTSINAFPKAARKGFAPWNREVQGYLIEGIRPRPEGSVDFVIRAGAGGRVLREDEQLAVSVLESLYSADNEMPERNVDISKMTAAQLREHLQENAPSLLEELGLSEGGAGGGGPAPAKTTFSLDDVKNLLAEQEQRLSVSFTEKLTEHSDAVEERAQELLEERAEASDLAEHAAELIEASGLPIEWQVDLKRRYAVLPSGPTPALQVEEKQVAVEGGGTKTLTKREVIAESVDADVKHAQQLIESASGRPRVHGLGGGSGDGPAGGAPAGNSLFRDWLKESSPELFEEDGSLKEDSLKSMVREGVQA